MKFSAVTSDAYFIAGGNQYDLTIADDSYELCYYVRDICQF